MKTYNLGTKQAGHNSSAWASDLERCLYRHFSIKPLQGAATKVVLGCRKQQDQEESFSLCKSAARLWHPTLETVLQEE